jgi:hypothetical protein
MPRLNNKMLKNFDQKNGKIIAMMVPSYNETVLSFKPGKENMKLKDGVAIKESGVTGDGHITVVKTGGEPYRPEGHKTKMTKEELE